MGGGQGNCETVRQESAEECTLREHCLERLRWEVGMATARCPLCQVPSREAAGGPPVASATRTSLAAGSANGASPRRCARQPRSPSVTAAMAQCSARSARPFSALPPLATPPVSSAASSCSRKLLLGRGYGCDAALLCQKDQADICRLVSGRLPMAPPPVRVVTSCCITTHRKTPDEDFSLPLIALTYTCLIILTRTLWSSAAE